MNVLDFLDRHFLGLAVLVVIIVLAITDVLWARSR
jgi:hypothetical protein